MLEWKLIGCAVDGSVPSRIAMEQAADLAKRFGADLTLIHVHDSDEVDEVLARWRTDAQDRAGRNVQLLDLSGDPASEIVRCARERHCDLLLIGTHGRTGMRRLVLGSVAETVIRRAHCPVLVARDEHALERESDVEELKQYTGG